MTTTTDCSKEDDDVFGPIVGPNCREGFDFTLLFEQSILTLLPAAIFLVVAAWRFSRLSQQEAKTRRSLFRVTKIAAALGFVGCQISLAYLLISNDAALSWIEDARSVRPSTVLCIYLMLTILLDLPQARTLWLLGSKNNLKLASHSSASIVAKMLLLVLEAREKRKFLAWKYHSLPPEATSSIINRSLLWWLNSLVRRGFCSPPLTLNDLHHLEPALASAPLEHKLRCSWDARREPERRFELVWALWNALRRLMLKPVLPQLCLIGLQFTQPFLIASVLGVLSSRHDDPNAAKKACCLVVATAMIYIGQPIAALHYHQAVNRSITMSRGALVALIYDHALLAQDGVYDSAAAVTLMSTDTTSVASSLNLVHKVWARSMEVALGIFLLAHQLGWVCVIPVAVVALSSFRSLRITKQIGNHQKIWIAAVEKRVSATSSVLTDIRSIKMIGLANLIIKILQAMRVWETDLMAQFRWDIVWQNVVSSFPYAIIPPLTFGVFGIQAALEGNLSPIDTARAFASLSIMRLVTGPAAELLSAIPMTAAGIGSFDRIQRFLLTPARQDFRAISAHDLSVRPAPLADLALRDVSFSLSIGSVTMFIGPVGSGKSTLLRAILGEGVPVKGAISTSHDPVAYCAQTPWLLNATIRKAICGHISPDDIDDEWYQSCVHACVLDHDLNSMPDGDETKIGSGGATLSGGQKQRVALARALYSRAKALVLDDVLSALDTRTAKSVVEALFGEKSLLEKLESTTVVLATYSAECLSYADKIIALSNGKVSYDGTYSEALSAGVINRVLPSLHKGGDEQAARSSKSFSGKPRQESESTEVDSLTRSTGDIAVYKYYFRSIGWQKAGMFLCVVLIQTFCDCFGEIWLKWWSDIKGGQLPLYLSIYMILPILNCMAIGAFVWSFLIYIAPSSANKLHYILLNSVMRAPQSFLSSTDSGKLLNMFSQDMSLIESPLAIDILRAIASVAFVATVSLYVWATIPAFYIAKQMRFLDLEAKSPLYSHFLETMSGLVTIRALGWEEDSKVENFRLLDLSQRPYYLMLCCQRWLILVLSLIVGVQTVIVVALAMALRSSTDPGFLGVSLTTIIGFESLLTSVGTGWTDLEISLGSVARLKNFERDVQPEGKEGEDGCAPSARPDRGVIEFLDVTASHSPTAVGIRDVSLQIHSGQKVGICGRTGSGKSSLIGAILRLLEIDRGSIIVDGLDLSTIPRNMIRERIMTLPQDPLILAGSVRLNVDPEGLAMNQTIIDALSCVELWSTLRERPGGLDADVTAFSLSEGQQQLLALARAIIRARGRKWAPGSILVLDEPTSSVDLDTDTTMQRLLKEEFARWTVVTVAHRVETILGSDMVAIMDGGSLVELGEPRALLSSNSRFAALVQTY
ncbi:ABC transporter [Lasiosphaeris hirsuta]|uniref:ABC transporter n=1 Tax=Lasiosphaeris hirsuta TaxID=260670 RepID=A0AA39ZRJ5_9PEZI|nr:ABC transporter [Lasiosphaeris hirsuta]